MAVFGLLAAPLRAVIAHTSTGNKLHEEDPTNNWFRRRGVRRIGAAADK